MLARTDGVLTVAASGIAMGLVAVVALSPVLEALLSGVTVRDPVTYVVVGATLGDRGSPRVPRVVRARDEDRSAPRVAWRLK